MLSDEFEAQVCGIGALAEPARRTLYFYVASQADAVSREQAAEAVGLPLHTAKFHLDRLVDEGLLDVEFRRLSGRTGPGAGRPSKLYRRSDRQISVSLPERRYDLAGEVLAEAVDLSTREGVAVSEAVVRVAEARGRRIGASGSESGSRGRSELERTADVLADYGYEPRSSDWEVVLTNCPFDSLARDHTELVCGLNLALVGGVLEGLHCSSLEARLDPEPGLCCVRARVRG